MAKETKNGKRKEAVKVVEKACRNCRKEDGFKCMSYGNRAPVSPITMRCIGFASNNVS